MFVFHDSHIFFISMEPDFNFRCATLYGMIPLNGSRIMEANARRVLPVLTVFAEWSYLHPLYLGYPTLGMDARTSRSGRSGERGTGNGRDRDDVTKGREEAKEGKTSPLLVSQPVSFTRALLKTEEESRCNARICIISLKDYVKSRLNLQGTFMIYYYLLCMASLERDSEYE